MDANWNIIYHEITHIQIPSRVLYATRLENGLYHSKELMKLHNDICIVTPSPFPNNQIAVLS